MPSHRSSRPRREAPSTNERLVAAQAEDGVHLSGLLMEPTDLVKRDLIAIWIHTRQLGFAEPEYIEIGRRTAAAGVPFLTVNTRGHGFGSWCRGGEEPVLGGSAWEVFTDCVYDLEAWVDVALDLGYHRVLFGGHGFGGAKALHYQAQSSRREVAGLALASSASAIRQKMSNDDLDLARSMREEGKGRDLMPWGTGGDSLNSTVSADWYLDRAQMFKELYGHGSLPPALARITCPVFAWFGSNETRHDRDVRAFLDLIRGTATRASLVDTRLLRGVDFFYTGGERQVSDALLNAAQVLDARRNAA